MYVPGVAMCEKTSCLGEPWCSEWDCCTRDEPLTKKAKTDAASGSRFPGSPTMKQFCKSHVPKNTDKATGWALRVLGSHVGV